MSAKPCLICGSKEVGAHTHAGAWNKPQEQPRRFTDAERSAINHALLRIEKQPKCMECTLTVLTLTAMLAESAPEAAKKATCQCGKTLSEHSMALWNKHQRIYAESAPESEATT